MSALGLSPLPLSPPPELPFLLPGSPQRLPHDSSPLRPVSLSFLSSALLAGVQGAHCAIQGEGSWGCPPAQLSFLNTAEWQVLKAESQETWDPVPTVPLNSLHDAC